MGHAARANPRSFDGARSITERSRVYEARLDRFMTYFATREEYESYVAGAKLTDAERGYLESRLPERLKTSPVSPPAVSTEPRVIALTDLREGDVLGATVDGRERQFIVQATR